MKRVILFALIVLLGACETTPPTPTPLPLPTPVASNSAWTPVVQDIDGYTMVLVPAGCFMMGSEEGRRDERPVHEVCFEQPFWIDQTEVTNAQYGSTGNFPGDNRPRENLLWSEARDFCVARGGRLPTEAEWEYAARGPDNLMYPWGNELVEDNLVFDRNSNNETADVGSRPQGASWVGAYDMSGNVFEFVHSAYKRYPYDPTDGREDGSDTTSPRVFRGGVNNYIDFGAGATMRFQLPFDGRDWFVGFRCMREYQYE